MNKLKIMVLADFFSSLGGTENYNYHLICGLKKLGADILVCIGERPKQDTWINLLNQKGIQCCYPERFHKDLSDREIEKNFFETDFDSIYKAFCPDIIYVHPAGKMYITYMEKYYNDGIPIVGTDYTAGNDNTSHWYVPELPKYINSISAFVSRCKAETKGLRIFHKYTGPIVEIPHLIPLPNNFIDKPNDIYSVGCILRLTPEKGLGFLLGAWKKVIQDFPTATLHIYGNGAYNQYYNELGQCLGVAKNIVFEGTYTPDTGIDSVASNHKIFVQPSLFESIPNALIELLLRKRCIIASDVGGISELIPQENNAGILIPSASTDAIYSAIKYLFTHQSEIKTLAKHGYTNALAVYNYDKNIQEYYELFCEVANNKK